MSVLDQLLSIQTSDIIRFIDLLGVATNALLGGAMARVARLDAVGFIVLAILSGMGGGIIRDMMLQRGTVAALTDEWYLIIALAAAGVAWLIKTEGPVWDKLFPYLDALALGTWSATGALKALSFGLDWIPAVLLGTITAVGGGFMRDVVLRRVPTVLGGNTLYATAGAFGAGVMVVMYELGYWTIGPVIAMLAASGLCLVARWRNWMVPVAYDWGGLRYETERYAQAIARRGRRLREAANRVHARSSRAVPGLDADAERDAASEHSHRSRGKRRIRLGGTNPVTGSMSRSSPGAAARATGPHRVVPPRDPATTGSLPRIMRDARKNPAPKEPPAAG